MTDATLNTEVVAPTNPPTIQTSPVPTTPGITGTQTASTVSIPPVQIAQPPEPLIKTEEPKPSVDIQRKSYAFILPVGSTDDDKQSFTEALAKAKKDGAHVVIRPDVKVVEL